jgi:hypothetical protein
VDAAPDAALDDIVSKVTESPIAARRIGHRAGDDERDPVGPEEPPQGEHGRGGVSQF